MQELAGTSDETTPARLMITSGGMQGLDLACKLFVDPGDLVVVESPTYTNGSATALSYQADLLEVPVDGTACRVDVLEDLVRRAGRTPKAIYAIPTFQNPSGATLSLERRRRLLELARWWGSMVIDDDPYSMLRFEGEPVPTLHELAEGDPLVFSVRTFSKIIAPGLRVGWVDTAPGAAAAADQRQAGHGHLHQPPHAATRSPASSAAATSTRTSRRSARSTAGASGRCSRRWRSTSPAAPAGPTRRAGSSSGSPSSPHVDTEALFPVALAQGVAFIPGNAFSPSKRFPDALRICFATTPPERIAEGVRRLARAVDRLDDHCWEPVRRR